MAFVDLRLVVSVAVSAIFAATAVAEDAWVIRGVARLPGCPAGRLLVWNADAVLHNFSAAPATVEVSDVSNGGRVTFRTFAIPAGESRLLSTAAVDFAPTHLWLTKLAVPDSVIVEGRLEYHFEDCSLQPQPDFALGRARTPVFRRLAPAGVPQHHVGTDLGVQEARLNVGVYNAGDATATATIEVRRTACSAAVVSRVIAIPPRTLVQTTLFEAPARCGTAGVPYWHTRTVVTVDQPSVSYAVALSNTADPNVTFGFGGAN